MNRTQIVEIIPRDGTVMYPAPDGTYTRLRSRAQLLTPDEATALLKVLRERWPDAQLRAVPYEAGPKTTRSCCGSTRPGPHTDWCSREADEDVY